MRWSDDQTCQFVKIYMKHVHLWNPKHENYKERGLRLKAYRQIITDFMEATGVLLNLMELKIKIKNLRSTYTQELIKIKRRSTPDCAYKSCLKWFPLWHEPFASGTKEEPDCSYDQQDPIDDSSEGWGSQINNSDSNVDPFQENENYVELKTEPEYSDNSNHSKVKKKKIKLRSPSVDSSDRTFRGSMDSSDMMKEDEFDIYGKYIASQLRKMDLEKALRVQLEIQSLVSEARISEVTDKH